MASLRVFQRLLTRNFGNVKPSYCICRYLSEASVEPALEQKKEEKKPASKIDLLDILKPDISRTTSSQLDATVQDEKVQRKPDLLVRNRFRTDEADPANHTDVHEGLFYTIPKEEFNQILPPKKKNEIRLRQQAKTFQEGCLMVRKPALEIMDLIQNHINYQLPAPKILLYGRDGTGKSFTLVHVIHHCYKHNWMVLHLPWPYSWLAHHTELSVSAYKSHRIDLPLEAQNWIEHFATMNSHIIRDLKTNFSYTWTKRESTEVGVPLQELIDFGVNRLKHADDVVGALLKEIRHQTSINGLKVLLVIDGVNCFWNDFEVNSGGSDKTVFPAKKLTLVHQFVKLLQNGMKNSVTLCTVDSNTGFVKGRETKYTPLALLGKQGFEELEPFIPIEITGYNEKEIHSCISYYIDRLWIQNEKAHTDAGRKELTFLSGKNPFQLSKICAVW